MTALPLIPPAATAAANTYTDLNALSKLKKDPGSPQAIKAVAQQVDALFLQMMLKSMRDASADMGVDDGNEMSMYQDMFDKQVSLTMSQHQDLGLGALLTRQMPNATAAGANAAATPAGGVEAQALAQSPTDFVKEVLPAVSDAAQALGLNPLGVLAQAVLETGWGKRMVRNADGSPSLNLFGVKADDAWQGARASADSLEYGGGTASLKRSAFRAYASIADSVSDFAHLLQHSPRYQEVIAAGGNAQAYAESMGRSGYATDPRYANKLNEILHSSTFRAAVILGSSAL